MRNFPVMLFIFLFLLWPVSSPAQDNEEFEEIPATPELIQALQDGGYVLYLRHGRTDSDQPDQVPIDLDDCSTQRPLTQEGKDEIRHVGQMIRKAGIPLDDIHSSPLCRAEKSARLAFDREFKLEKDLMYTAHLTSEQKKPVVEKTRQLISKPVQEKGKNRMLVAHAPNLADIMEYFPEIEGSLIIFKPLGENQFEYLATIHPDHWETLLEKKRE